MDGINWIALAASIASLLGCWTVTNKVASILEGMDIAGNGVRIMWVWLASPVIARAVYSYVSGL